MKSRLVSTVNHEENSDTNTADLVEKNSEMCEKVNGIYTCKVCQKTARDRNSLGHHIESHIEGITLTCEYCGKMFRTRDAIRKHKFRNH